MFNVELQCHVFCSTNNTSCVLSSFWVGDSIRYDLVDKDSLVCSIEGQGFLYYINEILNNQTNIEYDAVGIVCISKF